MRNYFKNWFERDKKSIGFNFRILGQKKNEFDFACKKIDKCISRLDVQELVKMKYLRK